MLHAPQLQLIMRKLPPLPLGVGAKQRLQLLPLLICDAGGEGNTVGDPQVAPPGLRWSRVAQDGAAGV